MQRCLCGNVCERAFHSAHSLIRTRVRSRLLQPHSVTHKLQTLTQSQLTAFPLDSSLALRGHTEADTASMTETVKQPSLDHELSGVEKGQRTPLSSNESAQCRSRAAGR